MQKQKTRKGKAGQGSAGQARPGQGREVESNRAPWSVGVRTELNTRQINTTSTKGGPTAWVSNKLRLFRGGLYGRGFGSRWVCLSVCLVGTGVTRIMATRYSVTVTVTRCYGLSGSSRRNRITECAGQYEIRPVGARRLLELESFFNSSSFLLLLFFFFCFLCDGVSNASDSIARRLLHFEGLFCFVMFCLVWFCLVAFRRSRYRWPRSFRFGWTLTCLWATYPDRRA